MRLVNIILSAVITCLLSSILTAQSIEMKMAEFASSAKGNVGAGIMLAETGEAAWLNAGRNFPMQSVYKLPIAMAMLSKVDSGLFSLDSMILVKKDELIGMNQHSPIRDQHPGGNFLMKLNDLIRYAVSESDGTASDILMRLCGGHSGVMQYLSHLGIKNIHVINTEKEMGLSDSVQYKNYSTPREALRLLYLIYKGGLFKPETGKLLQSFMTRTTSGANRIRGLLPEGTTVAHKTGSSGTRNGITAATNDIGIVTLPDGRHLLIAVFVSDSKAEDSAREGVIARIARSGWDKWTDNKDEK